MSNVILPRELTAENGAKGLLSGEFFETREVPNPDFCGCGYDDCSFCESDANPDGQDEMLLERTMVSWTTIKDIYKMVVENFEVESTDKSELADKTTKDLADE